MSFINDNFKTAQLAPIALAAAGSIGAAPATVDIASSFAINYTGPVNGLVTIPNPTDVQAGDRVRISNVGTAAFSIGGDSLSPGFHTYAEWTGASYTYLDGGRNAGVSVPVAAVAAGNFTVTHNLAMPAGTFSSLVFRAYNSIGNEVIFKRNKAADTANVLGFSSPVAITTNLPITFDISPLA
jgi:hypothetical protein